MMTEDFNLVDAHPEDCKHDANSNENTLVFFDGMRMFVYPKKYYAICKCCGKGFEFIKEPTTKAFVEINNEERRDNNVDV